MRGGLLRRTQIGRAWPLRPAAAVVAALTGAMVAVIGFTAPAAAHSELLDSNPAAGAQLAAAPGQLELTFSDAVEPQFATMVLTVGDGQASQIPARIEGAEVVSDVPPAAAAAVVPVGKPVPWKVAYRVVSADGHPISGTIEFTVGAALAADASPSAAGQPTPTAERSPQTASTATPLAVDESAASGEGLAGSPWGWLLLGAALLAVSVAVVTVLARRRGAGSS